MRIMSTKPWALVLWLSTAACHPTSTKSQLPDNEPEPRSVLLSETFDRLYPLFLQRKVDRGPKAAIWSSKYRGRWVRWTGQLVSFSPNGVTFKQLQSTITFDVSLKLDTAHKSELAERLRPGAFVTYVGRLQSYDDTFRTFYLTNGDVVDEIVDGGTLSPPFVSGTQPLSSEVP